MLDMDKDKNEMDNNCDQYSKQKYDSEKVMKPKKRNVKYKLLALFIAATIIGTGITYYEFYNSEDQIDIRQEQDEVEALANRIHQDYNGVQDVLNYYDMGPAVAVLGIYYEFDVSIDLAIKYYDKEDKVIIGMVYMDERDANFPALDKIAREKAIRKLEEKGDVEGIERIESMDKDENIQRILSQRQ